MKKIFLMACLALFVASCGSKDSKSKDSEKTEKTEKAAKVNDDAEEAEELDDADLAQECVDELNALVDENIEAVQSAESVEDLTNLQANFEQAMSELEKKYPEEVLNKSPEAKAAMMEAMQRLKDALDAANAQFAALL